METQILERATKAIEESNNRLVKFDERAALQVKANEDFGARIAAIEEQVRARRGEVPGFREDKACKEFSLFRACLGVSTGEWKRWDAELEYEAMTTARDFAVKNGRVMSSSVDGSGGFLVPAGVSDELIELIRADSVVLGLGARDMSGLEGSPVPITRQTGGATGYWVSEGSSITASDQAVGEINLRPHAAAAMTKLSNRLLMLTAKGGNRSAEKITKEDLAATLALLIDLAALRGDGTGEQPIGIANTSGVGTKSLNANPTIDHLLDMKGVVAAASALKGKLGYAMHPQTWTKLEKLKDGSGRHYLLADPARPTFGTLNGFPAAQTTQIPTNLGSTTDESELYFGNWSEVIIASWGGLELAASKETSDAFEKRQTWIRVVQEVDIAVRHGASFCYTVDVRND